MPSSLKNTTDHTYMTHYSRFRRCRPTGTSRVSSWRCQQDHGQRLPLLGFHSRLHQQQVDDADIPMTNITGTSPGPLSPTANTLFYAPDDVTVTGAGGQPVLVKSGLNVSQTLATLAQTNLTALGQKVSWNTDPATTTSTSPRALRRRHFGRQDQQRRRRQAARRRKRHCLCCRLCRLCSASLKSSFRNEVSRWWEEDVVLVCIQITQNGVRLVSHSRRN